MKHRRKPSLTDLPEDVGQISTTTKLGAAIADQLHAAIETNPLLQSIGPSLVRKMLFQALNGMTRRSVINLSVLGSDDARQSFVKQLSSAARIGLQSRQFLTNIGDARADQALVSDELEVKIHHDRYEGRRPRPLCHLPDGRSRRPGLPTSCGGF